MNPTYPQRIKDLLPGIFAHDNDPKYYMPLVIKQENVTNPVPHFEPERKAWWTELTDRETEEVRFATLYAEEFNHGTDGHNRLNLIAKLTRLLDERDEN